MNRACKECGVVQPVSDFPKAGIVKGVQYYRHKCQTCYQKQKLSEEHYRMNKFHSYKKTLKCNRCGYDDWRALQFHHHNDDKEGTPSEMARNRSWDVVKAELDKCEVLCANCHQIEHFIGA